MNPLQQIPARVRTILYWTGYVVGSIAQLVTLVWVTIAAARPDVDQPLWLILTSVVLAFLTNQLNLLAGSNVTESHTVAMQAPATVHVYEAVNPAATARDIARVMDQTPGQVTDHSDHTP